MGDYQLRWFEEELNRYQENPTKALFAFDERRSLADDPLLEGLGAGRAALRLGRPSPGG